VQVEVWADSRGGQIAEDSVLLKDDSEGLCPRHFVIGSFEGGGNMRQTIEERATAVIEDIGFERAMKLGQSTAKVTAVLHTVLPEAEAKLREPLACGHPRACLYPGYCPPGEPGWRSSDDGFCTACRREAAAVAEARDEAFEEAYQECWVSRNSDEIADAIRALIDSEERR
jgi:hypothetical protein